MASLHDDQFATVAFPHLVSYAILALSCAWIVFLVIVSVTAALNNR